MTRPDVRWRDLPMTLQELRGVYLDFFYRNQDWFRDQQFMRTLANESHTSSPIAIRGSGIVPTNGRGLPLAVDLARAYVCDTTNPIWAYKLWCRDEDDKGHRVYVKDEGKGLEIHRYFEPDETFGIPVFA